MWVILFRATKWRARANQSNQKGAHLRVRFFFITNGWVFVSFSINKFAPKEKQPTFAIVIKTQNNESGSTKNLQPFIGREL